MLVKVCGNANPLIALTTEELKELKRFKSILSTGEWSSCQREAQRIFSSSKEKQSRLNTERVSEVGVSVIISHFL